MTVLDRVREILQLRGGEASLREVYDDMERLHGIVMTRGRQAGIRKEIERHSSHSALWDGFRPDVFYTVAGIGRGLWGLR